MGMATPPESIEQTIEDLRGNMPLRRQMSMQNNGGASRICIMSEAIESQGLEGTETVDQWYFEDRGFLVIDLREGSVDE